MNQELFLRREVAHRIRSIENHLKEFRAFNGLSLRTIALNDDLAWLEGLADAVEFGAIEFRAARASEEGGE